VVARRKPKLLELKEECKSGEGEIKIIAGDLTNRNFRVSLIKQIIKAEAKIDYLINNAGYGTAIHFADQEREDLLNMFELNMVAVADLSHMALKHMKSQQGGRIINISSGVAFAPTPYFVTYNTTKSAISMFTRSLRQEVDQKNIKVSVVFPSMMSTGFANVAFKCYDRVTHKKCVESWQKMGAAPLKTAKYIVRKLDSRKLILLPTIWSKFLYLVANIPYFARVTDFISRHTAAKWLAKNIRNKKAAAHYYRKE
jgi:short-subunit dehydrogenase